jgi:hypothetical protein
MMLDRIFALLAYAAFLGFIGIVVMKVGRTDLTIASAIGAALAGYDIWSQLFARRR